MSNFKFKFSSDFNKEIRPEVLGLFAEEMENLDNAFQEAIEAEIYPWSGLTRRRNGEIVGSPRDIVDTGELKESQSLVIQGGKATFEWEAEHAAKVIRDRDWVNIALMIFDPLVYFKSTYTGGLGL